MVKAPWYIISQDNRLYNLWKGFSILCSLFSSYFYGYIAAFRYPVFGDQNFTVMLSFEFVFLCSIGFKFLCEFTQDGATTPTRDLKMIADKYIRSEFILDLIPLIPIQLMLDFDGRESHLYIIKCIRMINGFRVFDLNAISREIRKFYFIKLERIIRNDPVLA